MKRLESGEEIRPKHPGSKPVPRGHPQCLKGKNFVFTGVLDLMWREQAQDLVSRHGGRLTTNVTGGTTFLIAGDEPGKRKMTAAVIYGTKIIDEDGLLALVATTSLPQQT